MRPRIPGLVLLSWTLAAAVVAIVAAAVARALASSGARTAAGMHMQMAASHALTRAGSGTLREPLLGSALVTAWQLDAIAVVVLAVLTAVYLTGVALVPRRSPGTSWPLGRTLLFLAGVAVCVFATCGSIAVYDQVLFSAHMAGHLALVMVAPALFAGSRPLTLLLAASPPTRRARLERIARGRVVAVVTAPPVALATYAAVIVGTHLTGLMDTIMRNAWAGQVEHLVYLLVGYQFFVLIVGEEPIRWRLASPARWLLLAVAMAVDTFTGIVLLQGTTAARLMPSMFSVDALSDTRTGGSIMWFGGDAIMAAIMIGLVVDWLRKVEREPVERGWLEQARSAAFAAHTGTSSHDDIDADDEDDSARRTYNDWLARLDR